MTVKLSYFGITGLGEPIRLMLAVTNTPFEDYRVNKNEWSKLKPTLLWPHLPMLEIDGKTLFQSLSICRHLARKNGLCGSNDVEFLECDMTVDALDDMRKKAVVYYYTPDSKERDEGLKKAAKVDVPLYLKNFDKQLTENKGYFVGGKLTWADIIFLSHTDYISHLLGEDILANYHKLKQHQENLSQLPGVKEWLETRPECPKDFRSLFM